MVYIFVNKLF